MLNIHKELLIAQVGKYEERATPQFLLRHVSPPSEAPSLSSQKANPTHTCNRTHTTARGARKREIYGLLRTYCVQERDYSILNKNIIHICAKVDFTKSNFIPTNVENVLVMI